MKARNEKTMSASLKMRVSVGRAGHGSLLKWVEMALTVTAIAAHLAVLIFH